MLGLIHEPLIWPPNLNARKKVGDGEINDRLNDEKRSSPKRKNNTRLRFWWLSRIVLHKKRTDFDAFSQS